MSFLFISIAVKLRAKNLIECFQGNMDSPWVLSNISYIDNIVTNVHVCLNVVAESIVDVYLVSYNDTALPVFNLISL